MFVSLTKLSQEKSPAGELASFLLGKITSPGNEDVKRIAKAFNKSFEAFKDVKEVKNNMSMAEKWRNEGWLDGKEEGEAIGAVKGATKLAELIKGGLSVDEALLKINEAQRELAEAQ